MAAWDEASEALLEPKKREDVGGFEEKKPGGCEGDVVFFVASEDRGKRSSKLS